MSGQAGGTRLAPCNKQAAGPMASARTLFPWSGQSVPLCKLATKPPGSSAVTCTSAGINRMICTLMVEAIWEGFSEVETIEWDKKD